jgi:hypoxanthine phosphoribosyltransferase
LNTVLTIIGLIVSLMGLAITLYLLDRRRRKTWGQMIDEVDKLYTHLRAKKIGFECIVCFPDGGLIAADLLHIRHCQDIPITCISLNIERPKKGPKIVTVLTEKAVLESLRGKSILVIDDVVQTGRNLEVIVNYIMQTIDTNSDNIYTAVLGRPQGAHGFEVDYVGFEYPIRIKLPWGEVPRYSD